MSIHKLLWLSQPTGKFTCLLLYDIQYDISNMYPNECVEIIDKILGDKNSKPVSLKTFYYISYLVNEQFQWYYKRHSIRFW